MGRMKKFLENGGKPRTIAGPVAAVGIALVDLALAFEPDLVFPIARAGVEGGAGAAPAGLAMAEVNPLRLARGDHPQLAAMAFRRPLHRSPPRVLPAITFADPPGSCRGAWRPDLGAATIALRLAAGVPEILP